jgi:hypothetical protein
MEEKLIKKLMTSLKCDSCGKFYEIYDIDVLGHRDDLWYLKVLCSTCHTQSLVAVIVKEERMLETVADLKDMGQDEFGGEVVIADDVLNMHNFLKDFDGDFARLFIQK